MTDSPREFCLASSSDGLEALADALKDAAGAEITIRVEPERPLAALEVQILLAAAADASGPAALRIAPASPRLEAGLRLLGLEGRFEVVA